SSSSNTTSMSSATPATSSTSVPKAVAAAARSSPRAHPRRSPRWPHRTPVDSSNRCSNPDPNARTLKLPSGHAVDPHLGRGLQVPGPRPACDLRREGEEPPQSAQLVLLESRPAASADLDDGPYRELRGVDRRRHRGRSPPA